MAADSLMPDTDAMVSLVHALATSGASMAGHESLCTSLWDNSDHRLWLTAALMRKASTLKEEPDETVLEFLAQRAAESLRLHGLSRVPAPKEIAQLLPAIISLLPERNWQAPASLWPALLNDICREWGLPYEAPVGQTAERCSEPAAVLARLFADAIDAPWSGELDSRLEEWRDRPEFTWLAPLRASARFNREMQLLKARTRIESPFRDRDLRRHLEVLRPDERRRWLKLCDESSGEELYSETQLGSPGAEALWCVRVPLQPGQELRLSLLVEDKPMGRLLLRRADKRTIVVSEPTGLLAMLPVTPDVPLELVHAAAEHSAEEETAPLGFGLSGVITPSYEGAVLTLRWNPEVAEP